MLKSLVFLFFSILALNNAIAADEYIIESKVLGYKVRYWVHVPERDLENLPVLYVTDGKWYKEGGGLIEISEKLVKENKVNPHIIVLVDAFNPDKPSQNRRNNQFLCNEDYVSFYKKELVPVINEKFKTSKSSADRGMLGLSFGGLNSMFFALRAYDTFGKIGIQSPAPHPCPDIYNDFRNSPKLPIDIFLSTGTVNDKANATRRLKNILDNKGYDFEYVEVPEGHNWKNWKPLLDDVLIYFYGLK